MSKKVGNAVKRNRVKRLIREFFRCSREQAGPGLDVVIVPKRGVDVTSMGLQDVSRELLPLLNKAAALASAARSEETLTPAASAPGRQTP